MSCCYDSAKYAPLEMSEEASAARRGGGANWDRFPSSHRRSPTNESVPTNSILVKTGGNALAAVDKSVASDPGIASVTVPEGVKPGQQIYVTAPDGSGRYVSVTVPDRSFPGHVFLVRFPTIAPLVATGVPVENADEAVRNAVVPGEDVGMEEVKLTQQPVEDVHKTEPLNSQNQNLVLVRVPPGTRPGDKIRTQVSLGGQYVTVEAVVPEGNVSQFYVQLPPQNVVPGHEPPRPGQSERVLVQVPPGVTAGSTIRVALPGGRMIDAVVPQGNVSQFYVEAPDSENYNVPSIV